MKSGIDSSANESTVAIMLCAAGSRFCVDTNMATIDPPSSAKAIGTRRNISVKKIPNRIIAAVEGSSVAAVTGEPLLLRPAPAAH